MPPSPSPAVEWLEREFERKVRLRIRARTKESEDTIDLLDLLESVVHRPMFELIEDGDGDSIAQWPEPLPMDDIEDEGILNG